MPNRKKNVETKRKQSICGVCKLIQEIIREAPKYRNKRKEKETSARYTIFTSQKDNRCQSHNPDNSNDYTNKVKVYFIKKRERFHNVLVLYALSIYVKQKSMLCVTKDCTPTSTLIQEVTHCKQNIAPYRNQRMYIESTYILRKNFWAVVRRSICFMFTPALSKNVINFLYELFA